jgi:uncharacterized small protein (DUF1192 family)
LDFEDDDEEEEVSSDENFEDALESLSINEIPKVIAVTA